MTPSPLGWTVLKPHDGSPFVAGHLYHYIRDRQVIDGSTARWVRVKDTKDDTLKDYKLDEVDIVYEKYASAYDALCAGPRVVLPPKIDPVVFTEPIDTFFTGTEIYCGSAHLALSCEKQGFDMTRLDRDTLATDDAKNWRVDFGLLDGDDMVKLFNVSYVHASPECKTFSRLAMSKHKRNLNNRFLGKTHEAHKANGMLLKLFNALKARLNIDDAPFFFTIENPDCAFTRHPLIKQMVDEFAHTKVVNVSFCAFGAEVKKNTSIVTNSPTLIELTEHGDFFCGRSPTKPCAFSFKMHKVITKRAKCCGGIDKRRRTEATTRMALRETTTSVRGPRTETVGLDTPDVTPFPSLLTDFIANCIKRDVAEAKGVFKRCDTTCCAFVHKHQGVCSYILTKKAIS